jgi:hypothetical protein
MSNETLKEIRHHVQTLRDSSQGWVDRNTREGFPEAAASHTESVVKYDRWLAEIDERLR